MKNYFVQQIGALWVLLLLPLSTLVGQDCCHQTMITAPNYCGGIYGNVTWLYLKSAPTDRDLETGTLITLTDNPPNLFAVLQ